MKDKQAVVLFCAEELVEDADGYFYIADALERYQAWRTANGLKKSRMNVYAMGRYIPDMYPRKVMNRDRQGQGTLRAIVGWRLK
jgi:hypothetical protein